MRFAYCDPPYPGMAHLYKDHPDYAGEVDHAKLIARLVDKFPDGWALSTASTTLQYVLAFCPEGVRIASWCRPHSNPKPPERMIYAWEPLILCRGRPRRDGTYFYDYLVCSAAYRANGANMIGRKPPEFCAWLFRCLGALPGDELCDLFPGSGAVGRAWDKYQRQMSLPLDRPRTKQEKLPLGVA